MARFLRPAAMLLDLALRLGPNATPEDAERAFDTLVLRGLLKPAAGGFWELETLSDAALQRIVFER